MKCQQQQIVVYNSTIKTELKRDDWVGISIHEKKKKKVYLKPLVRCYYSSVTQSEKKKKRGPYLWRIKYCRVFFLMIREEEEENEAI
mmetsp:Transcript_9854/g.15971  ORF Transcript_9854/g.15971 Transcript_9854/m.15971 type:complete len:87 (-) Transcript_9854:8-268(-)